MEDSLVIPKVISVDDHAVEPPDLWTSAAPASIKDRVPRVERANARFGWSGGKHVVERTPDGDPCDFWLFEDYEWPFSQTFASVGVEEVDNVPTNYDIIRPGAWIQSERLRDMDDDGVEAALCFPNTLPRFCGQTFSERTDKDLSFWCLQTYNDWIIDEWGGGAGRNRLLPAVIVPFWDVDLAVRELKRCTEKGAVALSFSENPANLGFPSLHSSHWDTLFAACEETQSTVAMHIGSGSRVYATSDDSPFIVSSCMLFVNPMGSILDFIFSGTLERFPRLKLIYLEGQAGWVPYVLERADKLWAERGNNAFGSDLRNKPSSYMAENVFHCIFDDDTGLRMRDVVGMDQICFETDYPHPDGSFPNTRSTVEKMCTANGLSQAEVNKLTRLNAIRALSLERFGFTS